MPLHTGQRPLLPTPCPHHTQALVSRRTGRSFVAHQQGESRIPLASIPQSTGPDGPAPFPMARQISGGGSSVALTCVSPLDSGPETMEARAWGGLERRAALWLSPLLFLVADERGACIKIVRAGTCGSALHCLPLNRVAVRRIPRSVPTPFGNIRMTSGSSARTHGLS